MSNILSQDEINALLGAISESTIPSDETDDTIKIYDHARPIFLSPTSLGHFDGFFNQLAFNIEQGLGDLFETVSFGVSSVDMLTFDEFVRSVPNPTIIYSMTISDIAPVFLEIGPEAGGRILGAGAGTSSGSSLSHEFHSLELNLLGRLLLPVWDSLQSSLSAISKLKATQLKSITNPTATQAPSDGQILLTTFEFKSNGIESMWNLALPRNLTELLAYYLEQYNVGYFFKTEQPSPPKPRTWSRTMRLNLDMGQLGIDDLAALQTGDKMNIHEIEEKKYRYRLQG